MMFRHNRQLTWQLQISLANEKIPSGLWDASHCIPLSYVHSGSSWTCKTSTISYSGREFAPPVPLLWLIQLRDVRRRLFLKTKTKFYSVAQPSSHIFFLPVCKTCSSGKVLFFDFLSLADVPEPLLTSLSLLRKSPAATWPSWPHPYASSSILILFPRYLSLLPWPVKFLHSL